MNEAEKAMFQALNTHHEAGVKLILSSWTLGWRSLLLRHYEASPHVEEAVIPPLAEQTIVLVTRGSCEIESMAAARPAKARYDVGSIGMTAPNRPTRLRWWTVSPLPHQTLHLHLPVATTARVIEELWDFDPARATFPDTLATHDPLLERIILELLAAATAGTGDFYAEAAANFLAVHLLTRHGGFPPPRMRDVEDQRIRQARSFLRQNFHLPLTLAEIADSAALSQYHFLRLFRESTGETPFHYLTRLRIEQAQHELVHSASTVGEIALRCGFPSTPHFANTFRRKTGYTPTGYRRLHNRLRS